MKRFLFFQIIISSLLFSQLQPVLPYSDIKSFVNIDFYNSLIGFVVGGDSALYRSVNSGKAFTKIPVPGNKGVTDIFITKNGTTYICGNNGLVCYSYDIGETWQNISLTDFPGVKLLFIEAISPTMLIVTGENGFFAKSSDHGTSWVSSTTGTSNVNQVVFVDFNRGFAMMDYGTVAQTLDGGLTWQPFYVPIFGSNYKYFFDLGSEWVFLTENGYNISTINRGQTFSYYSPGSTYKIVGAWRASPTVFYTMDNSGRSRRYPGSPTGGITLPVKSYRGVWSSGSALYAIADGPDIVRTVNSGATVESTILSFGDKPFQSLVVNSATDWTVSGNDPTGASGMIARTTNAGTTWQKVLDSEWVNSCYFINSINGFRVRSRKVDYTTNGGTSWSTILTRTTGVLISEQSFNINDGFFIETDSLSKPRNLAYSRIYKRVSATATLQLNITGVRLTGLKFIDPQNGWVLRDSTRFYVTTNAGSSWLLQPVVTPFISSYERIGDSSGILVTQTGRIMKTTDNAATWTTVFSDSTLVFQSVAVNDSNWLAVGDAGAMVFSRDYGNTWQRKETGNYSGFTHVKFTGPDEFLLTTGRGGIFKGDLTDSIIEVGNSSGNETLPDNWLVGNYPNPFNSSTTIEFNSHDAGPVSFIVYDITGKTVHSEVINAAKGKNRFHFEANGLNSGIYFYLLDFGTKKAYSKMILLK